MKTKTVFISYSTKDRATAAKVRAALEADGIEVTIDSESLTAGGDIHGFIDRSIRETNVTLSIVSRNSLESDWVALESVESFTAEKYVQGKKFIAGYIDDQFLSRPFLIEAVRRIDLEIDELGKLIDEGTDLNIDTVDLQTIKSRKFKLRNNLSDILDRLRGSLTLDLREPEFEQSMRRIIAEINRLEDPTGPERRGTSGGTARRDAGSQTRSNPGDEIKYHHRCDRREQVRLFRNEVAAYLGLPSITRPLIFFIHGGKNGAFDHIFSRLEDELREELENYPGSEGIERHNWTSRPKPGSSQDAICENYVQWRYRAYGKKAEEYSSILKERLRNLTGRVQLVQLKWSADEFSRQPAEEIEPLLSFARSWYGEVSMPVIWLIGIEYGAVTSLESIFRMKFAREKKVREWLTGFSVEGADGLQPGSPVTLEELREVTIEEVDTWRQGAAEILGFDLDRMLKLEDDIRDYFQGLKRSSVDMSTLIGKLRQLTA
jgi:hypothetical protein